MTARPRVIAALALVCAASGVVGAASGPAGASDMRPYIVGGTAADVASFPYVVRLVTQSGGVCSGTLIAPTWVLTAGHCIEARAIISGGGATLATLGWSIGGSGLLHPGFTMTDSVLANDFGLYRLDQPAPDEGTFVELADYLDAGAWQPGGVAVAYGWGTTSGNGPLTTTLLQGAMKVVDDSVCDELTSQLGAIFDASTTMCTYAPGVGLCNGDSGGPLLATVGTRRVQVGVASYGAVGCFAHSAEAWVPAGLAWIRSTMAGGAPMVRSWGRDRYGTAASIAEAFDTASTVFIATGENFPDSLAAGVSAAKVGAPVLLVATGGIPSPTRFELQRLRPTRVVVAGGPAAVSDALVLQLTQLTGVAVERVGGVDRYETASLLTQQAWPAPADRVVWVAAGASFADPLIASAAAAVYGEPFVLVEGSVETREAIRAQIVALRPTQIMVVGDATTVSDALRVQLAAIAPLSSIADSDVHARSVRVWDRVPSAPLVLMATSANFPDALAGVAVAGLPPVTPLVLSAGTCLPAVTNDRLGTLGARLVVLLGGPVALSGDVERKIPC